ncbi:hypothetical protein HDU96_008062 [Phlyctochytrium bullatum]|nr:hypothetical protein HDU96_008062 [Phlyctochytrium bullatum]
MPAAAAAAADRGPAATTATATSPTPLTPSDPHLPHHHHTWSVGTASSPNTPASKRPAGAASAANPSQGGKILSGLFKPKFPTGPTLEPEEYLRYHHHLTPPPPIMAHSGSASSRGDSPPSPTVGPRTSFHSTTGSRARSISPSGHRTRSPVFASTALPAFTPARPPSPSPSATSSVGSARTPHAQPARSVSHNDLRNLLLAELAVPVVPPPASATPRTAPGRTTMPPRSPPSRPRSATTTTAGLAPEDVVAALMGGRNPRASVASSVSSVQSSQSSQAGVRQRPVSGASDDLLEQAAAPSRKTVSLPRWLVPGLAAAKPAPVAAEPRVSISLDPPSTTKPASGIVAPRPVSLRNALPVSTVGALVVTIDAKELPPTPFEGLLGLRATTSPVAADKEMALPLPPTPGSTRSSPEKSPAVLAFEQPWIVEPVGAAPPSPVPSFASAKSPSLAPDEAETGMGRGDSSASLVTLMGGLDEAVSGSFLFAGSGEEGKRRAAFAGLAFEEEEAAGEVDDEETALPWLVDAATPATAPVPAAAAEPVSPVKPAPKSPLWKAVSRPSTPPPLPPTSPVESAAPRSRARTISASALVGQQPQPPQPPQPKKRHRWFLRKKNSMPILQQASPVSPVAESPLTYIPPQPQPQPPPTPAKEAPVVSTAPAPPVARQLRRDRTEDTMLAGWGGGVAAVAVAEPTTPVSPTMTTTTTTSELGAESLEQEQASAPPPTPAFRGFVAGLLAHVNPKRARSSSPPPSPTLAAGKKSPRMFGSKAGASAGGSGGGAAAAPVAATAAAAPAEQPGFDAPPWTLTPSSPSLGLGDGRSPASSLKLGDEGGVAEDAVMAWNRPRRSFERPLRELAPPQAFVRWKWEPADLFGEVVGEVGVEEEEGWEENEARSSKDSEDGVSSATGTRLAAVSAVSVMRYFDEEREINRFRFEVELALFRLSARKIMDPLRPPELLDRVLIDQFARCLVRINPFLLQPSAAAATTAAAKQRQAYVAYREARLRERRARSAVRSRSPVSSSARLRAPVRGAEKLRRSPLALGGEVFVSDPESPDEEELPRGRTLERKKSVAVPVRKVEEVPVQADGGRVSPPSSDTSTGETWSKVDSAVAVSKTGGEAGSAAATLVPPASLPRVTGVWNCDDILEAVAAMSSSSPPKDEGVAKKMSTRRRSGKASTAGVPSPTAQPEAVAAVVAPQAAADAGKTPSLQQLASSAMSYFGRAVRHSAQPAVDGGERRQVAVSATATRKEYLLPRFLEELSAVRQEVGFEPTFLDDMSPNVGPVTTSPAVVAGMAPREMEAPPRGSSMLGAVHKDHAPQRRPRYSVPRVGGGGGVVMVDPDLDRRVVGASGTGAGGAGTGASAATSATPTAVVTPMLVHDFPPWLAGAYGADVVAGVVEPEAVVAVARGQQQAVPVAPRRTHSLFVTTEQKARMEAMRM